MSREVIAGNPAPIQQGFNYTHRKGAGGGLEYDIAWAGSVSAIKAKFNALTIDPKFVEANASQSPGSAIAVARARYAKPAGGSDEQLQESLSLKWNDTMLDIHRNPAFVNISTARIKQLNIDSETEGATPPTDPTELQYFNIRARGTTGYRFALPVVTYTIAGPYNTQERLNVSQSGKIFDAVEIPVSSFFVLGDINVGLSADLAGEYMVGWRLMVQGDYLANGNAQLIEEYEFGLWESVLYEAAT
jgi:hypothetical protein